MRTKYERYGLDRMKRRVRRNIIIVHDDDAGGNHIGFLKNGPTTPVKPVRYAVTVVAGGYRV